MHGQTALETERSLISTIVYHPDVLDDVALKPSDFQNEMYAFIFRTVCELREKGIEVNLYTVMEKTVGNAISVEDLTHSIDVMVAYPNAAESMSRIVKDHAGRRKLIEFGKKVIDASHSADTAQDALAEVERTMAEIVASEESTGGPQLFGPIAHKHLDKVEERYHNRGKLTGVDTGLSALNEIMGGWQPSDFVIIAARPSMGKTGFMLYEALKAAGQCVCIIFSLEMSLEQLSDRMFAAKSRVPLYNIRNGLLEDDQWVKLTDASAVLEGPMLYVDDRSNVNLAYLRSQIRKLRRKYPPDTKFVVFLDYLQLVDERGRSRIEEVNQISKACKAIAKDMNCTFVALSQLSRACETRQNKRPILSDLRESGGLEQDADIVGFLYRDEYYNPDTKDQNIMEIIVAKHRNGPTGTAKVVFLKQYQMFHEFSGRDG